MKGSTSTHKALIPPRRAQVDTTMAPPPSRVLSDVEQNQEEPLMTQLLGLVTAGKNKSSPDFAQ